MAENNMKHADFKKCVGCGQGMMHTGLPLFWRVSIERMGIDMEAVRQAHGMELMMGGHAKLANLMGPDRDLAKPLGGKQEMLVCEKCALEGHLSIAALMELSVESAG